MNILITGVNGFVGLNAAKYYCSSGKNKVYGVDNLSREALLHATISNTATNLKEVFKLKVLFFERDVRDLAFLKTFFKSYPIDLIIHCAAQTAVTSSIVDPSSDFQNNVLGSFNVLETVRQSGQDPTIVLMSTNKCYGNNINDLSVKETDFRYEYPNAQMNIWESFPIDNTLHSPYGTSKLCADLYFQEYGKTYGLKTGIFRCSCIYGPYQNGCKDQGWIVHFILSALRNEPITIFGNGKQVRDILHVDDLIRVFELFYKRSSDLKGEVFNIGGGVDNTISLLELITILESELDRKIQVNYDKERLGDQKVYVSDVKKAFDSFGWKPLTSKAEGLFKTIQFYKGEVKK